MPLFYMIVALVSCGCHSETQQTEWLEHRNAVLEAVQDQGLAGSVSGEVSLPSWQMATF